MSSWDEDYIEFDLSARSSKIVKGIFVIMFLAIAFCVTMFIVVNNSEPDYATMNFVVEDDELKIVELTIAQDESIYYKLESDNGISVRLMTKSEYNDMINGHVYSYIEDDWKESFEKVTDPLDADTYVLFVKGDTYTTTGTLYYGVQKDPSGSATWWIGGAALSPFVAALCYIIFTAFAGKNKRVVQRRN